MIRGRARAAAAVLVLAAGCAGATDPAEPPAGGTPAVRVVAIDGGTEDVIGVADAGVQAAPGQVVRIRNANQGPAGRAAAEDAAAGTVVHVLTAGEVPPLFTATAEGAVANPAVWQPCLGPPPADPTAPCGQRPDTGAWDGVAALSTGAIGAGSHADVRLAEDIAPGTHRLVCALHPDLAVQVVVTDAVTADPAAATPPPLGPVEGVRATPVGPAEVLVGPGDGTVVLGGFLPDRVAVAAGEAVTWRARSPDPHQVRLAPASPGEGQAAGVQAAGSPVAEASPGAGDPVLPAGAWMGEAPLTSGWVSTDPSAPGGDRVTVRVERPGSYTFWCAIHPAMRGTLVVS